MAAMWTRGKGFRKACFRLGPLSRLTINESLHVIERPILGVNFGTRNQNLASIWGSTLALKLFQSALHRTRPSPKIRSHSMRNTSGSSAFNNGLHGHTGPACLLQARPVQTWLGQAGQACPGLAYPEHLLQAPSGKTNKNLY